MLKYILPLILPWLGAHTGSSDNCKSIVFEGRHYITCQFDPSKVELRLYYKDPKSDTVLRSFTTLQDMLTAEGRALDFAMNAGMYHHDMSPVGLYVEDGKQHAPLITGGGWGNFHLLPNGVFYLKDGKAQVMESLKFAAAGIEPQFATQSGPMLLIDGAVHPKFLPDSDSLKIRNGVGVSEDGIVHFAISTERVRFYDFAILFRDLLKTQNALYFDGTISSVVIPELGRFDRLYPMGPMIAVSHLKTPEIAD